MNEMGTNEICNYLRKSELCSESECRMCQGEERESIPVSKTESNAECASCRIKFDVFFKKV